MMPSPLQLPLSKPKPSPQLQASHLQHFSLLPLSPLNNFFAPADRGLYILHLLVNCCNHVAYGNVEVANSYLEHISILVDSTGDPVQRLASYFTEALAHRLLKSFPGLYRALHVTRSPPVSDTVIARRCFFDIVPFPKLAAAIANQVIVEAMEEERVVHVIDLNAWDPSQWVALMHILSIRCGGPPHLRITGVHDREEVLGQVAARLSTEAELLNVPFQFNPVLTGQGRLDLVETLIKRGLKTGSGEALAICSMSSLHQLFADDEIMPISGSTHIRSPFESGGSSKLLLTALRSLSPKIMVVAEKEFDCNSPMLRERFTEAMTYYAGLFDSLEVALPRESEQRAAIEKSLFGLEIRNIIACEGAERKERHEKFEKWARRLKEARFSKVPLSYERLPEAEKFLGGGSSLRSSWECRVMEQDGCVMICWQTHPIFSVSAWKCKNQEPWLAS